uniref:G-protein coupled receptors family 1 profile domain-containing protein n=1 Tax=Maylandia zebra TaxID=106582 RepID=A0A3P9CZF8_9CICH
ISCNSSLNSELCFPQLFNISCKKPTTPLSQVLLLYIVVSSMSLLTVTLNLLVIIAVSHFRQLHTPTNILLLSLAVTDFLVGLLFMPGEILRNTACWFLVMGNMVLISVDRYVAICDPLHYPTRITERRVKLCVCLCWLCSVFYCYVILIDDLSQPGKHKSCYGRCIIIIEFIAGFVDLFISFIIPLTVIIVLYMRVFVVAVSQARAMRSQVTAVTLQLSVTLTAKKSELKALLNSSSASIVIYMYYFNSCLNPLIYAMFYPWFRKAVKLIVTLQILQPGSCEISIL